jgi:hypothetical protein
MNTESRKRLTTLFYVLTRDHLPWGTLHGLIDKHALVGTGEHVYCSDAARALADAAIDRLLAQAQPESTQSVVKTSTIAKGSRVFVKPECPLQGGTLPGHPGIVQRVEFTSRGRPLAMVRHANGFGVIYGFDNLLPVEALVGRTFQHRDGAACALVDIHTNVCGLRWSGDDYEVGVGLDAFINGDFTLLPEHTLEAMLADGWALLTRKVAASLVGKRVVLKRSAKNSAQPVAESEWLAVEESEWVVLTEPREVLGITSVTMRSCQHQTTQTMIIGYWYVKPVVESDDPWVDVGPNHSVRASALAVPLPSQTRPSEPARAAFSIDAGITVDTAICSFDDALQHAIALAQDCPCVRFHHGFATVAVEALDTSARLRDRWQRETDRARGQRARLQDGRAHIANELRDAGFTSAGWTYDDDAGAIVLSCADVLALLRRLNGEALS